MYKLKFLFSDINFQNIRYLLLVSLFIQLSLTSFSQSKQGSYWYFGERAGVYFNISGSVTAQTNGATNGAANLEGTATISDTAGNLLFYTDGQTVWNRNHVVMTNGTGLLGHPSSTQSGVIVPHPKSADTFYIFTIDAAHNNLANGLRYSIVKMSLSGGMGAVTATKNILLSPTGVLLGEKITSVKHCNNRDIWVICHGYGLANGNKFYAYLISPSGISTTPIISTIGTVHNGGDVNGYGNARGYMKASADGKKIALAIPYDGCPYPPGNVNSWTQGSVEVFDLDTRNGIVSNPIKFTSALYKGSYGIEFSPGGNRLYASQWGSYNDPSTVWQWNLAAGSAAAVQASATLVASPVPSPGALQLALNGKIYIVKDYGTTFPRNGYLDAFNFPNNIGVTSGYTANVVALGTNRYGRYGLPTFISSYFNPGYNVSPTFVASPASFTIDDTTQLDSVYWSFGDPSSGALNHSKLFNPKHTYLDTGTYLIQLIMYKCGVADTLRSKLPVYPVPDAAFTVNDSDQCITGNSFAFTNKSTIAAGSMTFLWKFGDNTTSTLKNPSHTYTLPGVYTVWLIATSDAGGKDSVSHQVIVRTKPIPGFLINNASQCLSGNKFEFRNTSQGATSYLWNFGDAATSTATSPSHTYTTAGTYSVKLVATAAFGCVDSITKTVDVRPQPVSGYTINNTSQCLSGNNFVFTNTSSGAISYLWNFGDATTSTATSPSHSYTTAGAFSIKLVAITVYGCKDSITRGINVRPQPVSAFTINNNSQCINGNNFVFTNTTTGAASYLWKFGDAATSTATSPSHSYATAGTFSVKLVSTTSFNCKDSVTKTLDVRPKPVPSFTIKNNSQCLSGNNFEFTNTSTGASTYLWNFGDGFTSVATSPIHSYIAAGTYTVKLVSISAFGCKDSTTRTLDVRPQPVSAYTINNNSQCLSGNNFSFTNTSTGASTYLWKFGDATTSAATSPSHSYTSSGTYSVKLISTTTFGCKDSITKTLDVRPQPVSSYNINNNSQCLTGNNFVFTNTSSGAASYLWRFGDATTSTATSPSHSYTAVGTYTVKLISTTTFGCKDSITKTLDVRPKPVAAFTIPVNNQCLGSNNYSYTNTSTGASTYLWNFGDAATSTATSPTHSYATAGTFTAKLIATTAFGCKDSTTRIVNVRPGPVATYTINNSSQCLIGNSFTFTNTSTGATTYLWTFGDAASSAATSPTHSYTSIGTYSVKLVANSAFGCKDSISKTVTVSTQPTAAFTINNNTQCLNGNSFAFTNTSTGATNYLWRFGDATTSALTSPTHSYTTAGAFTVKIISSTALGCKDSTTKIVNVMPHPRSSFIINDTSQCLSGNNFTFRNTTTIPVGTITYKWSFGDGGSSIIKDPSHVYTTANTFNVKLVSTSNQGCSDSITKQVLVTPQPSVNFSIDDSTQCVKSNKFSFTNSSSISSGSLSYKWSFGDGNTATTQNSSNTYIAGGTYNVKLVATSGFGCSDSTTKKTYVYFDPVAKFNINDTSQCQRGNNFVFTNSSTIGAGTFSSFWTFGDGANASTGNASHIYATDGTYKVKLVVTSNNGCKDSVTKTDYIYPNPKAKFMNYDSSQCLERNNFGFVNMSTITSGTMGYFWKFGDGATSVLTNPSHSYASAGLFTVTLLVTSDQGCIDSFLRFTFLHIHPEPRATYGVNDSTQCLKGNSFLFTNNSTITAGTITPLWDFDDGNTSVSTPTTTHTYITTDTFNVKLLVVSDQGCKDSIIRKMIVYPMPKVDFTVKDTISCLAGNSFSFINNTTISSGLVSYSWDFGDGKSSIDTSPVHTYAGAGTYQVKLTVTSGQGCIESITKSVYVYPPPAAAFSFLSDSSQCLKGNSFMMKNNTTVPAGSFTSLWYFGDGDTSTLTNPTHSYSIDDTFYIKLVINTSYGCTDSITKMAEVNFMPIADFSINDSVQCFNGNNFIFTNKSLLLRGNFFMKWHFGDGDSSAYLTPAHIYRTVDSFPVSLIVRSQKGCIDSIKKTTYVRPMPTASFTVNDTAHCLLGNSFIFTNSSTISTGSLYSNWSFGDTSTSTQQDPIYSYTYDGSFNARLVVSSAFGCSDTAFKHIDIYPSPKVVFSINDTGQCLIGNSFSFTNSSYIKTGTIAYNWDLGDATTSTLTNTSHSYLTVDTFLVKLVATSQIGCSDSMSKNVYTFAEPVSSFTVNNLKQCFNGNLFNFTNNSSIGVGTYSNYWQFGDGDTSTGINPVHSYKTSDSFNVTLSIVSDQGCSDTSNIWLYVNPMPQPAFSINSTSQCLKANSFVYTNNSTIKTGAMTYNWDLGDATTSTLQDITHSYSLADSYTVRMVAQSAFGCFDSISKVVYVRHDPIAGYTLPDTSQCFKGNLFVFTNTSTLPLGNFTNNWNFGDGDTSSTSNPIHSYAKPDSFDVVLITLSDFNCADTFKRKVYVNPNPIAGFSINNNVQYLPNNKFVFTNSSVISSGINTYLWDFGDASTSSLTDPDHVYGIADSFVVMLIASSDKGCPDTVKKTVYVLKASIIADFTITNACQGDTVFFKNVSQLLNDTFSNFIWDFGDTTSAVKIENPYHIYKYTGAYTVKMIALSKNGYKDSMSHTFTILPRPLVNITYVPDTVIYQGQKVTLTANGVFDKVLWSTGEQTSSIDVDTQGLFSVIVSDTSGCKSYASIRIILLEKKKFGYMTVITPNGDGINDYWKVFDIEQYQPCKLVIYNRWGDELYSNNKYYNDWNGTYKGKTLPEGSYYFIFETKAGKVYKGAINVVK